ncbi:MAG: helix-turn-helix transcriptional regulator [Dehalococcoidia bacterium]
MNVTEHLPLAPRDLMILAVLAEGPLHGYGLIKAVEERSASGVLLDPANLYRALRRMRALEWIEEAADAVERRRTHRITGNGRAVLAAEVSRLERLLVQARPAVMEGG